MMKPIKLGIIFDQNIFAGGGYQQALNSALLVRNLPKEQVEVIFFTTLKENYSTLENYGIKPIIIQLSYFERVRSYFRKKVINPSILKYIKKFEKYNTFEKKLINNNIDLVYFLSPSSLPQNLEKINYITTIWDLSQRDDPEFPEVRWERQLETRDQNYASILPRATAIFVDSELGKKNTAHRYGVDLERIYVMPFEPAYATRNSNEVIKINYKINIKSKYQIKVPYVFYPAQFWAHKNHVYLLAGLKKLEKKYGKKIGVIFCGSDKGNLSYIKEIVKELDLNDRVRFAGFVSNEEIVELYTQSIALVMPSYFGPTNLPPLEAFQLGVPVLYSDKAGLRDQVEDAALLMDLKNSESMADHLNNVIDDEQLRERMINAGYERLKYFAAYNRNEILINVIEDFRWRRICWK